MRKIAIITKNTTFNKYFGGLEIHTKLLVDRLAEKGFEVHIFAPIRELKNDYISDGEKKYYFVDCDYKTGPLSFYFKNSWYQKLLKFFSLKNQENKYDLVISVSSAGFPILFNKDKYSFKIFTICHGSAFSEFKSIIYESGISLSIIKNFPYFLYNYFYKQKKFILNSDSIVAVSNYVKDSVISETGLDEAKMLVIHNGAKIENYEKEFTEHGILKVLFAGRVERSKGIMILLSSVKDLDVELIIAGNGALLESAKQRSKELRIEHKVKFLGKLDTKQLNDEYKKADILVAPSLRIEGFPMSIVEGMAYYLPIIASKVGGNSDAVFEGRNGFLVEPNDAHELNERIKFFNTYPEKIKQFGLNSRNLAEQKFNLDIMIDEYLQKINELMKGSK